MQKIITVSIDNKYRCNELDNLLYEGWMILLATPILSSNGFGVFTKGIQYILTKNN